MTGAHDHPTPCLDVALRSLDPEGASGSDPLLPAAVLCAFASLVDHDPGLPVPLRELICAMLLRAEQVAPAYIARMEATLGGDRR